MLVDVHWPLAVAVLFRRFRVTPAGTPPKVNWMDGSLRKPAVPSVCLKASTKLSGKSNANNLSDTDPVVRIVPLPRPGGVVIADVDPGRDILPSAVAIELMTSVKF